MVAKLLSKIRKDFKERRIAKRLLEKFGIVKKNDNSDFKMQSVGAEYTDALFSPVSAIMLAMADVYGTFALPVTAIDTDISIIDLSVDSFPVNIRIMTTQPGLMNGEGNKYHTELLKRLSEVFHISEDKLSLRFVPTQDIHVVDY